MPGDWLANIAGRIESAGGDVAAALQAMAANGRLSVAECYVLGVDPDVPTNDFRIVSIEMVDGKPQVEWEPKTNRWTGEELNVTLKGAANLNDKVWTTVTDENRGNFRFFKVEVALP